MAKKISGSVGKGGKNVMADVKIVQSLLNQHASGGKYGKLKVDGQVGPATIKAIRAFQVALVPGIKPDSVVDKGKKTIAALNKKPKELAGGDAAMVKVTIDGKDILFKSRADAKKYTDSLRKVVIEGTEYHLTPKQLAAYTKKVIQQLKRGPVLDIRLRASGAESIWNHFAQINREELFASWCVQLWGPKLPPFNVVTKASSAMNGIDSALSSGDPQKILKSIVKNQPVIDKSYETMFRYRKAVLGRTVGWIKGLEFTKTSSFVIVGAIAAPQLVVAGATTGQAAFLVGVGTSALPSVGNEIGKSMAGTSQGAIDAIYNVGIDSAIGGTIGVILKGKAGSQVLENVEKKILAKITASKYLSKAVAGAWAKKMLAASGKGAIEESVKTVGNRVGKSLKGESYTKSKFYDDVTDTFIGTFTSGMLKPFDTAVEKNLAPKIYESIMKSKVKVTLAKDMAKKFLKKPGVTKVALKEVFGSMPKSDAIKSIQETIKGSGGNTVGTMLKWGVEKFGGASPDKLVAKTGAEALKSPEWAKLQGLILKQAAKKVK